MNVLSLHDVLNMDTLVDMAGDLYFERGEDYFQQGRVLNILSDDLSLSAVVSGRKKYKVKLWLENDELLSDCSCPMGDSYYFCKHCVAVGLAWLNGKPEAKSGKANIKDDLEVYLKKQPKQRLVKMLMEQVMEHKDLRDKLVLDFQFSSKEKIDVKTLYALIDQAVNARGFVHYSQMWEYANNIEGLVEHLRSLLNKKNTDIFIGIIEHFIARLEEAMMHVDDSNGNMGGILRDLEDLHLEACKNSKCDKKILAKKLFEWEMESKWETFYQCVVKYSQVLGKEGLKEYKHLAKKVWDKVSSLKPGDKKDYCDPIRFKITSIMEALAYLSKDVNEMLDIKSKDLSSAYCFLKIAEFLKASGEDDKALEWAEKGLKAFSKDTDSRLREFLAAEYQTRGRGDDALNLVWLNFCDRVCLENYKNLYDYALKNNKLIYWRKKALAFITKKFEQEFKNGKGRAYQYYGYSDILVEIFLWEKDVEEALKQAKLGNCSERNLLELAKLCSKKHPEESLKIYGKLVEHTIDKTNNEAYAQAVEYLKKMKKIQQKLNKEKDFSFYIMNLCEKYKKKRNFIKLVNKYKLM